MSTLNQIGLHRGFSKEYVRLIHPGWPDDRIDSFWRSMNAVLPRKKPVVRTKVLVCDWCHNEYTVPRTVTNNNRRYCNTCRDCGAIE